MYKYTNKPSHIPFKYEQKVETNLNSTLSFPMDTATYNL